jgi:hypothetical protein
MDRIELSVALVQVGVWLHPKEVTILMDALDADGRFTLVPPSLRPPPTASVPVAHTCFCTRATCRTVAAPNLDSDLSSK